jgi:hypothetical protein
MKRARSAKQTLGPLAAMTALTVLGCTADKPVPKVEGTATPQLPDPRIETVIGWLPDDTESVLVATSRITLSSSESMSKSKIVGSFMSIGTPENGAILAGIDAEFAVGGVRTILPTGELGVCRFEGCRIFALKAGEQDKLLKLVKSKYSLGMPIDGTDVYEVKPVEVSVDWPYWIAIVDGFALIATDRDYLTEVLRRRSTAEVEKRAFPEDFKLWKYVDRAAPFWAVRRFTPQANKMPYGMNMNDEELDGYAVSFEASTGVFQVTSVSRSKEGFERAGEEWGNVGENTTLKRLDDYTTRITVGPATKDEEGMGMLLVLAAIGHPVFI